jgi:hypothetical protein
VFHKVWCSEEECPRIVCLCGSTRFAQEFMLAQFQETMAGHIVLTVGCFPRKADGTWDTMRVSAEQKVTLDALHKRKIDLADEILVINVNGYIGESTRSEIAYARMRGKPVRYRDISTDGGLTWTVTDGVQVWIHLGHGLVRSEGDILVEAPLRITCREEVKV